MTKLAILKALFALSLPMCATTAFSMDEGSVNEAVDVVEAKQKVGYRLPERNEMYVVTKVGKNFQFVQKEFPEYDLKTLHFKLSNEKTIQIVQGGWIQALQQGSVQLQVLSQNDLELAKYTIIVEHEDVNLQDLHPHLEVDNFMIRNESADRYKSASNWMSLDDSVVVVDEGDISFVSPGKTKVCEQLDHACTDNALDVQLKEDYITIGKSENQTISPTRYVCIGFATICVIALIALNEYYRQRNKA
ncbi:hypothetical protein A4S06_02800 [Erysipelotrichaceae bacterium MTC7]|nr:hypothetical protein A4S06_02800 [Erysipelotrichaceae bacterium MTC7]